MCATLVSFNKTLVPSNKTLASSNKSLPGIFKKLILFFFITVSVQVGAVEFSVDTYDVYIGDLNNDTRKDFYFQGKDRLISAKPVPTPGFIIYAIDQSYDIPVLFNLTPSQLTDYLTQGKLHKAIVSNLELTNSTDILYWKDSVNGFTSVVVRGENASTAAFLLASYGNIDLPLIVDIYDPANASIPNLSNRNNVFTLRDVNGDARRDLVWGTQVLLTSYTGMSVQKTYSVTATATSTSPVYVDYFYDELGRLDRIESSDGSSQDYTLDAEDNRTGKADVKGI